MIVGIDHVVFVVGIDDVVFVVGIDDVVFVVGIDDIVFDVGMVVGMIVGFGFIVGPVYHSSEIFS